MVAVSTLGTPDAFFRRDADHFIPEPTLTAGPWGDTLGGQAVGGLLGWALDRAGDPELQPARLTVDLLRPVSMRPIRIDVEVQREGRRIKLVDAALLQDGRRVARASALFLRRGEHPDGRVWTAPTNMPAPPTNRDGMPAGMPFELWSYGTNPEVGTAGLAPAEWEQDRLPKFAWVRVPRPMVEGYPLTPFTLVAFVGDITSSLTNWGTGGLRYINADYTVTLSRLPEGEFIGLAAHSHHGADGIASGSATLFDARGPLGTGVALALAQPAEAFRPPHLRT